MKRLDFYMTIQSNRGSALVVTMVFLIAVSIAAFGVLSLSLTSHRLTVHNQFRAEAKAVAESELEALYYQLNRAVFLEGASMKQAAETLAADNSETPTTVREPFLVSHRAPGKHWRVRRSIVVGDTITGLLPQSTKRGQFTNIDVKIEVLPPANSLSASSGARVGYGRLFVGSTASIFQSCVFYQGCDLEMSPSGDAEIEGDVVSNSAIYMGASKDADGKASLLLKGNVTYLASKGFNTNPGADDIFGNGDDDDDGKYTTRKQRTGNTTELAANPTFEDSQANQLKTMSAAENLLGGVDATAVQLANPELFPTVNDVYRSLLVPPPKAGNTNEYSAEALSKEDDVTISAQRAYNRAGLVITVNTDGTISIEARDSNGASTLSESAKKQIASAVTLFDSTGASVSSPGNGITYTKKMFDKREKKEVQITEIDVAKLASLIGKSDGSSSVFSDFNGLLYINQMSGNSQSPAAVRLINGEKTPRTVDSDKPGFSVATNGGIYVKGNYNTTLLDDNKTINPAMLMGDALTVLSNGWNDNDDEAALSVRKAAPADGATMTINSGLLTGNTQASKTTVSGGVQNLVRYLEDWNGKSVVYKGSLGRLFDAKMFTSSYAQPGVVADVYNAPKKRLFRFDSDFLTKSPPGSPLTAATQRGRFYYW